MIEMVMRDATRRDLMDDAPWYFKGGFLGTRARTMLPKPGSNLHMSPAI